MTMTGNSDQESDLMDNEMSPEDEAEEEFLADPEMRGYFRDYRPSIGQSHAIPFFIRLGWVWPLWFAARSRSDLRYAENYRRTAEWKTDK